MNCMKCGVKIPEGQIFCDHCLSVMEQYPVKPDAHIHLPRRAAEAEVFKKPGRKKRAPSPEEQITALRSKVLRLRLVAIVLVFLIGVLAFALYHQTTTPPDGRNYTIDVTMND